MATTLYRDVVNPCWEGIPRGSHVLRRNDRGRDRGRKDMRGGRRSWGYRVRIWLSVVIVLQYIVYPLIVTVAGKLLATVSQLVELLILVLTGLPGGV